MKKRRSLKRAAATLLALAMCMSTLIGMGPTKIAKADNEAETNTTTIGMPRIVSDSVAAQGGVVKYDSINVQFLMGDFVNGGELAPFTTFGGDGTGGSGDVVGDGSSDNAVWRWQWRGAQAANTVLKITAKQDLTLAIDQDREEANQWAFHTTYAYYKEDTAGTKTLISEHPVTEVIPAGTMNVSVDLKAGETLYIVYYSTSESNGTSNYRPNVSVTTAGPAKDEFNKVDEIGMPQVVSDSVAAQGGKVTYGGLEAQFLMGDFINGGELAPFTVFAGDGTGGSGDVVGDGNSDNAVWRWQWRGAKAANTVLKLTATEPVILNVDCAAEQTGQWAFHTAYAYFREDAAGNKTKVSENFVTETIPAGLMSETVRLAAGESLYIVYYSTNDSNGTSGYKPTLKIATVGGEKVEPPLTMSDIVSASVAAKGGAVSYEKGADVQFLMGDFLNNGELVPFTVFAGDGSGSAGDVVGDGNGDNAVWRWQWRATNANQTILKITATKNIKLNLDCVAEQKDQWATNSVYAYYTEGPEGIRAFVSEHAVTKTIAAGTMNAEAHLRAGDTFYIVYYTKDATGNVTSGYCPNVVIDEAGYDAKLRTNYTGNDELGWPGIVSDTVAAKGGLLTYNNFEAQFLMGDFFNEGELVPFDKFSGDGTGGSGDVVGDGNSNNAIWRWQWRGVDKVNTVLKFVATEDIKLTIDQFKEETSQWATHTLLAYVAESDDGERLVLSEHRITETIPAGTMTQEVHLAKGDVFYIVYYSTNESNGTFGYRPNIIADKSAYDASLRIDFAVVAQLNAAIEECTATLQSKLAELLGDGTVYTVENTERLDKYVNDTLTSIVNMSSVESINGARDEALKKMSEVRTIAQDAEILATFKTDSKNQIAESVNRKNYSKNNWAVIEGIIARANKDIDEAKRSADVSRIMTKAMYDLKQVEMKESLPTALIAGIAVAVAAAAAVVVIKVKKKNADGTENAEENGKTEK